MLGALGLYELAAFEMPNVCIVGGGKDIYSESLDGEVISER